MNDQLDELLNAPLAAVADDGFSARVIAAARMERLKEKIPFFAALFICAAAVLLYVPLPRIAGTIAHFLAEPGVSLAAAALVLTFAAEHAWRSDIS
jgi:hypothetical protein